MVKDTIQITPIKQDGLLVVQNVNIIGVDMKISVIIQGGQVKMDGKKIEERFEKIEDELKTIKVFFDNRGFKVFSDNKPIADFTPDGVIHVDSGYVLGATIIDSPTHKFDGMTDEEVWNGYLYFKNSTEEYEKEIEELKNALKRKYPNRDIELMEKYESLDMACFGYKLLAETVPKLKETIEQLKALPCMECKDECHLKDCPEEIEQLKKHHLSDNWVFIIEKAITVIKKEKTKKRRFIQVGINKDIVINELQLNAMFDEFIKILTNKIT